VRRSRISAAFAGLWAEALAASEEIVGKLENERA